MIMGNYMTASTFALQQKCRAGVETQHHQHMCHVWGSRVVNWGGRSIEPPKTGEEGVWEKGSIERTINRLL